MSSRNSASNSLTALANLTATYTDSENEDDNRSDDDSPRTDASTESQVIIPERTSLNNDTPNKLASDNSSTPPVNPKKSLRLVSYNDDTVISDDENVSPNHKNAVINNLINNNSSISSNSNNINNNNTNINIKPSINDDKFLEYGFNLPLEIKTKCPQELQDKIINLYEKMKNSNMDMNKVIQERKDFRNPSIYEKLIQFCDINESGTNYPPEIYDPLQWGKESYYEELAKAQKVEMDKREKDRKEITKAELLAAAAKKSEDDAKKRKSKWDQPGPSIPQQSQSSLKPAGLIQPSLTTNVTGTKGTVISAFGSLPKKSKV